MSEIYKALLRADWERLTPQQKETYNKDDAAFPRIITPRVGPLTPRPTDLHSTAEPTYYEPLPNPTYYQTEESQVIPEHQPSSLPASIGRVRVFPWRPQLDKLPTLKNRSAFTEQFRSLRSRLYEYRGFNKLKTVLVSSGMPKEGKTFVAANLALSLARYKNSKVLLIDADLRKNSLHALLGCSPAPGLSSYLTGEATALEVMQRSDLEFDPDSIHPTVLSAITFIAGGNGGEGAADLSGNTRFADLIRFAEPHFDWIIVDSSPVNVVSDAVNLAPACDGVLLVVRGGITSYKTAQRAQKEFSTANLLGVVLNGASEAPDQAYYGYGSEPKQ